MAAGNPGKTYGVGPAATKMNTGPNVNVDAVLTAAGVVKIGETTIFDPATHGVEQQNDDPAIGIDYAASVGLGE